MLGDLQSSSLHQQVTGLLKVLQHTSEIQYEKPLHVWLATQQLICCRAIWFSFQLYYLNGVPHLHCSSRTEDELIGEHVSKEAETVENLL